MKVTLIYPGIGIDGFRKYATRTIRNGESNWIHHGLALIGAYLKQRGHEVKLIDLRHMTDWLDLRNELLGYKPDVVGVSISYMDYEPGIKSCEVVRKLLPDTKIVVGGLCPTLFLDMFIDNTNIDHIVTYEGEVAFGNLVDSVGRGESISNIIIGTSPDVNTLPYADRELFNYINEIGCGFAPGQDLPAVTMISGRGCPYSCAYCQPAERMVYGKRVRMRTVDNVLSELRELRKKYIFRSITWWDDTFTSNPRWIYEFCDKYEKEFTASMVACSRADIICKNEGMIRRLAEVGLRWFVIGFESGSQRMLDTLSKGTTVKQNIEAARICRKYGIKIFGTFMMGLPNESVEEQLNTYKLIKEIKPEHYMLFYFTPIPGTNIYDYCKDNNLILRDNELNIERTCNYTPKIRNIDYGFLDKLRLDLRR